MSESSKTVLITGASSGIGHALARLFAADGYHLVLCGRNELALGALATECYEQHGSQTLVIAADLGGLHAAEQIHRKVREANLNIDVLVNNAGLGYIGAFDELDLEQNQEMLLVNNHALVTLTHYCLPHMKSQGFGRILNVSSIAGFLPGPFMSIYYASKAFVTSFSQALYYELQGSGITATNLCPGATRTDFQRRARMEISGSGMIKFMSAEEVAKIGYDALHRGKKQVICGLRNKIMVAIFKLIPRSLAMAQLKKFQRTRKGVEISAKDMGIDKDDDRS